MIMKKCLDWIKNYRSGNRMLVETEYASTLSLRRKNAAEPLCKIEFKNKGETLFLDVLAVIGAVWALGRLIRLIGRLFH